MKWDLINCCGPIINEKILLTDGNDIYYFNFKTREEIEEAINDYNITHWGYLESVSLNNLPTKIHTLEDVLKG